MLKNFYVAALVAAALPSFSQIKINEFMTGGKDKASEEFIELYNPTDAPVNLKGWKIMYRSSAGKNETELLTWKSDYFLKAKEYYVAGSEEFPGKKNGKLKDNLSGTSGAIGLRDSKDTLTESVAYGKVNPDNIFIETLPCDDPAKGTSMSRVPDGEDTDDNSMDFIKTKVPTPGLTNTAIISSSLESIDDDKVLIFQTTDNIIQIKFPDPALINKVFVLDSFGRQVLNLQTLEDEIDLSKYPSGVYFINILTDQRQITKKVLVR